MSKIGFCFSGEGARGAIQSGIALYLYQQGIQPAFVVGTSSGSANTCAYTYLGAEGCADMWRSIKSLFGFFGINWNFLWNTGVLNQKPSEKRIKSIVQNKPLCEARVLRMNIETGELQYVSNKDVTSEEFAEATLGATAVTAMCNDRNGWVDAGFREMTPLKQCIEVGCDEIYVILGRPLEFPTWTKPKGLLPFIQMGYRALDISLYEILTRDIQSCLKKNGEPGFKNIQIHLMQPETLLYDSVAFRRCREGVEYGLTHCVDVHETALRMKIKQLF